MASTSSLKDVNFRKGVSAATPQTKKAEKGQKKNHAGGYTFVLSDLERVKRFLIMGSEESFYQPGAELSLENAKTLRKVAKSEQARELIDLITDVSVGGRAVKQQPALFALALAIASAEDPAIKNYGYSKLKDVARTGTTLFEFVGFLNQFQRFGMGARKAIAGWYTSRTAESLAYQLVKYQSRGGWSHADLLRLSKRVKSSELGANHAALLNWTTGKPFDSELIPGVVIGFEKAKEAGLSNKKIAALVKQYGLSWEMVPSEALNSKEVWEALLDGNVPLGALIRQLPRLTRIGLLPVLGGKTEQIVKRLTDEAELKKARIHPLQILVALKTYHSGRSIKGDSTWTPNQRIVDALDKAFYAAFKAVEPTGKRWLLALDASASMTWSDIAGMPINPREASAALALVTAATEPESHIVAFSHGGYGRPGNGGISPLAITPTMRLDTVVKTIEKVYAGGTDCSLPMKYALANNLEVDVFVVYTDNETYGGQIHPHEALVKYREATGIDAKLIVVGMTATKFTIANPNDPGMLDIAGFDTAAPGLMAEFAKGLA